LSDALHPSKKKNVFPSIALKFGEGDRIPFFTCGWHGFF
jgi:hypothetical protein